MENGTRGRPHRFPWRSGNRFELLVDGRSFYPAMLEAIATARHFILLEMYLVSSGEVLERFVQALTEAAGRGVEIFVLLDDFGSRGMLLADRRHLLQAGIKLRFYNPLHYGELRRNLFRDHRKLLLVDGEVAFTGGAGISDEFSARAHHPWHDLMLRVEGVCVADWQELFEQNWQHWSPEILQLPLLNRAHAASRVGRVSISAGRGKADSKRSLLAHIRGAEQRVWIATAYFLPSWRLRRALGRAAERGVDVRLLLPGPHTDNSPVRHAGRRFYGQLLRRGVQIHEYQPGFLHAKAALCDDWVSIGSSNIDRWNLRWNLEANQEAMDAALAVELAGFFKASQADCNGIDPHNWQHRRWYKRLLEWFWGHIDRWLARV